MNSFWFTRAGHIFLFAVCVFLVWGALKLLFEVALPTELAAILGAFVIGLGFGAGGMDIYHERLIRKGSHPACPRCSDPWPD